MCKRNRNSELLSPSEVVWPSKGGVTSHFLTGFISVRFFQLAGKGHANVGAGERKKDQTMQIETSLRGQYEKEIKGGFPSFPDLKIIYLCTWLFAPVRRKRVIAFDLEFLPGMQEPLFTGG